MLPTEKQKESYSFFQQELPNLLSDPLRIGKFAVILDSKVKGMFDTFEAAYQEACTKYISDFIIQQIIDEEKIVNYLSPAVAG